MKEKYAIFKEWKKNPRHKALYQLLCWLVFFFVLYLVAVSGILSPSYTPANNNDNEVKLTSNSIDNYGNMVSYEYEYNITYDDTSMIIKGIVCDNKKYYTIGDISYYDDGTLYLVNEDNKQLIANPEINLPIRLTEIDRNAIYAWLNDAEVYEKIEYNNGDKVITYIYTSAEKYEIRIIAKESEHLIKSLEIDLSQLPLTGNLQVNHLKIDINYTNINNISSYEKNYSGYELIGVEEEILNENLTEEEKKLEQNNSNSKPQVRPLTKEEV